MAPRKTSSKKSPVKKSSVKKSGSSMVKSSPKKTMMQKHGKKLAALATLLAAAGVGAGAFELKHRQNKTKYGDKSGTRKEQFLSMFRRTKPTQQ